MVHGGVGGDDPAVVDHLTRPYASGDIPLSAKGRRIARGLSSWLWVVILVNVLVVVAIAQFQLDWFAEFARM